MRYAELSLMLFFLLSSQETRASTCTDYPYLPGMTVETVPGGTKILATAASGVSLDDVDAINDARDEATLSAKARIAKFLREDIHSDEEISRDVDETRSMTGDSKRVERAELIKRVKQLSDHSIGLLRGVVQLGDCYTVGREVRVSIGLLPETIAAAGDTVDKINRTPEQPPSRFATADSGAGMSNPKAVGAPPSSSQPQPDRLAEVTDFADRICRDAPLDSRSSKKELSAKGKAEVGGFLKYLSDLGFEIGGGRTSTESYGVLQDQLAGSIANGNDCRKSVVHDLLPIVFQRPAVSSQRNSGQ
jgi:hypothetical protein